MKKILRVMTVLLFLVMVGCSNNDTRPTRERTAAEKTAFLIDTIVATAIYNDTNFGVGKEFVNTKSRTESHSVSTTSFTNGGMETNTVTKSKTKSKSEGFGFGIGY